MSTSRRALLLPGRAYPATMIHTDVTRAVDAFLASLPHM